MKGNEVAKKVLEVTQKIPNKPIENFLVLGAGRPVGGKARTISVIGCKTADLDEVMKLAYQRSQMYAEIEGFEYEIEILTSIRRMLELEGVQVPG